MNMNKWFINLQWVSGNFTKKVRVRMTSMGSLSRNAEAKGLRLIWTDDIFNLLFL